MNKKTIFFVIICSVALGGVSGWALMRFLLPRLNSIPVLVKYNLVPNSSPLVIHTREEIRVNEGSDAVAAIQKVKPWIVQIFSGPDLAHTQVYGAGLVLTSDGLIATTAGAWRGSNQAYVKLYDGAVLPAVFKASDSQSDLVFIKVSGSGLPTASLGFPKDLQLGQRMIIISPSINDFEVRASLTSLSRGIRDQSPDQVYSSDVINRTFSVDRTVLESSHTHGSAVISLDSNVQGLLTEKNIISADVMRSAMSVFFGSGKISRNFLGLNYQIIPKPLGSLYSIPQGIIVKKPDPKSPAVLPQSTASLSGLLEGDIIFKVDLDQIDADHTFEELISRYADRQIAQISILRGKEKKILSIKIVSR